MWTYASTSQSPIPPTSTRFCIQEFRNRSQASDESLEVFLPSIDVMSICARMYETKNAFDNTENQRVRLALIPAVFGDDRSSPLRVTSTGYKPVNCSDRKENSSKRKRTNMVKMRRKVESSWDAHARSQRWGYSSPAFHCRSPPAQLYKYKHSIKLGQNSVDYCHVPGMTIQQAILFRRTFSAKFLGNSQESLHEDRKHNNTPVCLEAAPQKLLKKHISMPNLKSIQTCQGDAKEGKEIGHGSRLRPRYKTVESQVKAQREIGANLEDSAKATMCYALCASEFQGLEKHSDIQTKKIDIKLPCLDTDQKS